MIFYRRPVALNRQQHRAIKLDTATSDFRFAASTNSVLLAASEAAEAAKDYPVVFIGGPDGPFTLVALVGLRENENLFVDEGGNWASGTYLPAFVRRYPFVLAEAATGETEMTVCIDEACERLGEEHGAPLFDETGAVAPLLEGTTAFLQLFHAEMQQTSLLAQRLADAGLLVAKRIEIVRDGASHALEGIYVVDRDKLAALDDTMALELFRSGALWAVHAHLMSLNHAERLAIRLDARLAVQAAE